MESQHGQVSNGVTTWTGEGGETDSRESGKEQD